MKSLLCFLLAALGSLTALSQANSDGKKTSSDQQRLVGAWHLVSLGDIGPDGKMNIVAGLNGNLIYTADGHMSVQIMYPPSASTLSNDYVLNGYEASFGSYDVDDAKHTVTHHVAGSITHGLVGKDLQRAYQITNDGRLVIRSTSPDERWQVVWEHQ